MGSHLDLKGTILLQPTDSRGLMPSGSPWRKALAPTANGSRRSLQWKGRQRILSLRRRAHRSDLRRPTSGFQRRVRTLKKLVPNSDCMGLDGLFTETADYILSLQMRVKVMQIMVKVLSDSPNWPPLLPCKVSYHFSFSLSSFFSCFFHVDFNVLYSEAGFGRPQMCVGWCCPFFKFQQTLNF